LDAVYVDGEWAERGEVTLTEAARVLDLSPMTVLRWIRAGILPAGQYCKGAPWVIKRRNVERQQLVERVRMSRKGPSPADPHQQTLIFQ
jgi:excisionase family DNA binding protein